jgi:hypothetical protein
MVDAPSKPDDGLDIPQFLRRKDTEPAAMPQSLLALTIFQPWASLILAGAKPIEWRGWEAPSRVVGQRIAIHAAARRVQRDEIVALLLDLHAHGEAGTSLIVEIAITLLERWLTSPGALPLSTVLCTAILGKPIRAADYARSRGIDSDRIDHAKWGWPLTEIEPVIPMAPARGMQGFWRWIPEPVG